MKSHAELHRLIDELTGDSPRHALAAYRRLIDHHLPWLERRAVHLGRSSGMSWAGIGRILGRSRQTLHERFGGPADVGQLLPPTRELTVDEADDRYYGRLIADARRWVAFDDPDGEVVPW